MTSEDRVGACALALWPINLNPPIACLDSWIGRVDAKAREAKCRGAAVLVLPELACLQWLQFAPANLPLREQPGWLAQQARVALPRLQRIAQGYGLMLVPGSFPHRHAEGDLRNRAFALLPSGRPHHHDKLDLTPSEDDTDGWQLVRGNALHVFEYAGLRVGLLVCLDIELVGVVARLAQLDVDLLLVSAGTRDAAGFHRVFDCAKARAVELRCAVAVVGSTGRTPAEAYVGGAAVFLPCEAELGYSGVAIQGGPFLPDDDQDELIVSSALPFHTIRRVRYGRGGAGDLPANFRASLVDVRLSLF